MTDPVSPPSWSVRLWVGVGAALFGVALAAGAWLFLVRLAPTTEQPALTPASAAWNAAWFSAFALHHSVMARSGAKMWVARHLPASLERSLYVWMASGLFLLVCALWRPTGGVVWALGRFAGAGLVLQVGGLVVTLLGAQIIDLRELAGLRQIHAPSPEWASLVPPDRQAARVALERQNPPLGIISTRGPYGWVRHPIYLGWVLLVWGTPVMTSGRLLFACVSTAYLLIAIPFEERSLVELHGDDYRRYQRLVRWRIVPGVF